ncbi:MAG: hypothetical protein ACRC11_13420, partial [Xenococcaceae cyanobacterium]
MKVSSGCIDRLSVVSANLFTKTVRTWVINRGVKVKKSYSQLGILAIAGLSILTAQPLCAANSQVTDLKLDSKKDGVADVFKTLSNLTKNIQSKVEKIAQTPIIEEKNPGMQNIPEPSTPTVIPSNNSDV